MSQSPSTGSQLPELARDTTQDRPWPLRLLSAKIEQYIARMTEVWVEGQIVQLNDHNSSSLAYITIRDTEEDVSMSLTIPKRLLRAQGPGVQEGSHVVTFARPTFWRKRGTLQLNATQITPLGEGDLLARIEKLKKELAAEGLFNSERKLPLPFLPRRIGLIAGPRAKAQDDVIANARNRWPAIQFEIRNVAVQGPNCVDQVSAAIRELDAHPEVDVIVITRGGGSVEDLLPFSSETMVRTAAAATTPIISAIGHETDAPLLDLVADLRASTPTDAAKRIVPDLAAEIEYTTHLTARLHGALTTRIRRERDLLDSLTSRPVLTNPAAMLEPHRAQLERLVTSNRQAFSRTLHTASSHLAELSASLRTLSPQSTLDRGYAVLRTTTGDVVRDPKHVNSGQTLTARVARGELHLIATDPTPHDGQTAGKISPKVPPDKAAPPVKATRATSTRKPASRKPTATSRPATSTQSRTPKEDTE